MSQLQTALENFHNSPHFWDLITLGCLLVTVLGFLIFLVWILGLPGRIAVARGHPDAEAVYTMGWVGFMAIIPWIQALIWAFKPTDKIDIRRFPEEERAAEREDLRRLVEHAYGRKAAAALDAAVREQDKPPGAGASPATAGSPAKTDAPATGSATGSESPDGAAKVSRPAGQVPPRDESRT